VSSLGVKARIRVPAAGVVTASGLDGVETFSASSKASTL